VYNEFKVKLRSQVTNTVVAFDVTPDISESRTVNYKTLEPVHMPGGFTCTETRPQELLALVTFDWSHEHEKKHQKIYIG